ncbi:MAG: hypothetical protein M1837_005899 [Sclerophora amabilis]|nr:MAG: hypothetical protein M1837_005899 [Sclerophora amabilis]
MGYVIIRAGKDQPISAPIEDVFQRPSQIRLETFGRDITTALPARVNRFKQIQLFMKYLTIGGRYSSSLSEEEGLGSACKRRRPGLGGPRDWRERERAEEWDPEPEPRPPSGNIFTVPIDKPIVSVDRVNDRIIIHKSDRVFVPTPNQNGPTSGQPNDQSNDEPNRQTNDDSDDNPNRESNGGGRGDSKGPSMPGSNQISNDVPNPPGNQVDQDSDDEDSCLYWFNEMMRQTEEPDVTT